MADDRNGEARPLSERDVSRKVFFRKTQTIGGFLVGIAAVVFAFVALLKFESVPLSILGWIVACLAFGLAHPDQVALLLSFRRNGSGGERA